MRKQLHALYVAVAIGGLMFAATVMVALQSTPERTPTPPVSSGHVHIELQPSRTFGTKDFFGRVRDHRVAEDLLIVLDGRPLNGFYLHTFDLVSGAQVQALGTAGQGPGEFGQPISVTVTELANGLYVYDSGLSRLTEYRVSQQKELIHERTIRIRRDLFDVGVSDTRVFANGAFPEAALQIGTISADWSVEKWEAVAPAVFDGIPMEVAIFLNRSSLAFDPGITRVAQAFLYASRLHIYSGTGENLATVAGPEEIPLSYRTEQVGPRERFLHNPDSRWGVHRRSRVS